MTIDLESMRETRRVGRAELISRVEVLCAEVERLQAWSEQTFGSLDSIVRVATCGECGTEFESKQEKVKNGGGGIV